MTPKHPEIRVPMVGEDGNAFAIMGRVTRAMRRAGLPPEEVAAFRDEATAGTAASGTRPRSRSRC